jgi:predicted transcriptional regulator
MEAKKLVPYSVYIPPEHHKKLKAAAKKRKASELIRDAIAIAIDGNDAYKAGYNQGLKDAAQVVYECKEAQMVAVKGKDVGALLSEQIKDLAK